MSVWSWVQRFEAQAYQAQDLQRIRLTELFYQALDVLNDAVDEALALLQQARALADQLDERWWVLLCEHWELQLLIGQKYDYRAAQALAVRAAVEARKPAYTALPQRICLQEDLIRVYVGIDPHGYAGHIRQALDYMEGQLGPGLECCFCLRGLRARFALALGQLDEAGAQAMRYLAMLERQPSPHYLGNVCSLLCAISFARGDWNELLSWAELGEPAARAQKWRGMISEFLAWQALALLKCGDPGAAQRRYRSATMRARRLSTSPGRGYFDALSAYHEAQAQLDRALQIRDQELAALAGKGQLWRECCCRLERCRLMQRLRLSTEQELAALRAVAGQLIDPRPVLDRISRLELNAGSEDAHP